MVYRNNRIEVIKSDVEDDESITLRLSNEYGFRWFHSVNGKQIRRKIKEAVRIEEEIQENVFGSKYSFVKSIQLD